MKSASNSAVSVEGPMFGGDPCIYQEYSVVLGLAEGRELRAERSGGTS